MGTKPPESPKRQTAPSPARYKNSLVGAAVIGGVVWCAGLRAPNPSALAAPLGTAREAIAGLDTVDAVAAHHHASCGR